MDPKSLLQQSVLGLGLGFTAKNIAYRSWQDDGRWWAEVTISDRGEMVGGSYRSGKPTSKKSSAEKLAASKALSEWGAIKNHFLEDKALRMRLSDSDKEEPPGWDDTWGQEASLSGIQKLYMELGQLVAAQQRVLRQIHVLENKQG